MFKNIKRVALFALFFSASYNLYAQTVTIGFDPTYAPFEFKLPDGSYSGFDYDLGEKLCKQANVECKWKEISFDGIIPALQAKKIDIILSAMAITAEREKQVDFSVPLYNIPSALVVRKSNKITPDNIKAGANVGVTQGTIQESYALKFWAPKGTNVVSYQSQEQVYLDLENNRLDATFTNAATASSAFLNTPQGKDFMIASPTLSDEKYFGKGVGLAFRKSDFQLKDTFNQAITAIKTSDEYPKLAKKYFNFEIK